MKVTFGQQTTKVKQLADLLSQEISMGKYKSDCTLPSINKLSREYQVSRDNRLYSGKRLLRNQQAYKHSASAGRVFSL